MDEIIENSTTVSTETVENNTENSHLPTNQDEINFDTLINRDFDSFQKVNPNISRTELLNDNSFRMFSQGKENKPLLEVYSNYTSLVAKISEEAISKERARQNNAVSAVGDLSGNQSSSDVYFTKEQVQRMTPAQIKKYYNRIRESQQSW